MDRISMSTVINLMFLCANVVAANNNNNNNLELYNAAKVGNQPAVVSALGAGADPSWGNPADSYGGTALHAAAEGNHADIINILLDAGSYTEKGDDDGATPLHRAAIFGSTAAMTALLSHSANVKAQDKWGMTPLMDATSGGQLAAAQMLVNAGADVALTDDVGDTALHYAAYYNKPDVVTLLLQNGADAKKQNNEGKTPADEARDEGYHQLADIIDNFTPAPATTTPAPATTTPARTPTTNLTGPPGYTHTSVALIIFGVCGAIMTLLNITYLVHRHRLALLSYLR